MPKITLYFPENAIGTVNAAKQIFKREGASISRFLLNELREYVRLHEPGNPQQRLDIIMSTGQPYKAKIYICQHSMKKGLPCKPHTCPLIFRDEDFPAKQQECEVKKEIGRGQLK